MIIIRIKDRYFELGSGGSGSLTPRTLGMTRDTLRLHISHWCRDYCADHMAEVLQRIDETGTSSKHYSRDQLIKWAGMTEDEIYAKYGDGQSVT